MIMTHGQLWEMTNGTLSPAYPTLPNLKMILIFQGTFMAIQDQYNANGIPGIDGSKTRKHSIRAVLTWDFTKFWITMTLIPQESGIPVPMGTYSTL